MTTPDAQTTMEMQILPHSGEPSQPIVESNDAACSALPLPSTPKQPDMIHHLKVASDQPGRSRIYQHLLWCYIVLSLVWPSWSFMDALKKEISKQASHGPAQPGNLQNYSVISPR
jgi:hypothetical protein